MTKAIATMVGILLLSHGGLGLFIEGEHLLGLFDVDIALDLTYLTSGSSWCSSARPRSRPDSRAGWSRWERW